MSSAQSMQINSEPINGTTITKHDLDPERGPPSPSKLGLEWFEKLDCKSIIEDMPM